MLEEARAVRQEAAGRTRCGGSVAGRAKAGPQQAWRGPGAARGWLWLQEPAGGRARAGPSQQDLQQGASLPLTFATRTRGVTERGRGTDWCLREKIIATSSHRGLLIHDN